jgi:tRNA threonylcarbamoyladenosine biosynthesis protein TsaE
MYYNTNSEKETLTIAEELSATIQGGDIILLSGELGAGKTTFTKGIAIGLGIQDTITSPTFALMNLYTTINQSQIKNFVHIDTYRLADEEELRAIGVEDYLGDKNTVCVIEWPEKIEGLLKDMQTISVHIEYEENNKRIVTILPDPTK